MLSGNESYTANFVVLSQAGKKKEFENFKP